jgi:outer membrane immunogenic protein
MKKLLLIGAAFAVLLAPAMAADQPVRVYKRPRPVVVAAPVYIWTGFYVGGNVGCGWGKADGDINYLAPNLSGVTDCTSGATCISGSDTVNMNGVIGGVQAGYNWQTGNWLAGVETDFQGARQRGKTDFSVSFNAQGLAPFPAGTAGISITNKLEWFGTVRGRVGYIADRWLFYATGGFAYGHVTVDSSASATGVFTNLPGFLPCGCSVWDFSSGATKTGWTAGGGVEGALGGNWTVKLEYLFIDLGRINTMFAGFPGSFGNSILCFQEVAGIGNVSSRITDNIVRVGLDYKFGNYYAPVVTK